MSKLSVQIIPSSEPYISSYYEALTRVARERVLIEIVEPPPLENVILFQKQLIQREKGLAHYAVDGEQVVGWCEVVRSDNPRQRHRGTLAMGFIPEFRGLGLGSRLIAAVLAESKTAGFEKIELHVYTTNIPAIALYKKLGFETEGILKHGRKLDGQYFDCLMMGKFL